MEEQEKFAEDNLICPISGEIMENPVVASDGHTYEKKEILQWMKKNKTSPLTREILTDALFPNLTVKHLIGEYHKKLQEEKEKKSKGDVSINKSPVKEEEKESLNLNYPDYSEIEIQMKKEKNKETDHGDDIKKFVNIKAKSECGDDFKNIGFPKNEVDIISKKIPKTNKKEIFRQYPYSEVFKQAVDLIFNGQPAQTIELLKYNENYLKNLHIKLLYYLLSKGGLGWHKSDPILEKKLEPSLEDISILESEVLQGNDFSEYFLARLFELNIHNLKNMNRVFNLFTKSANKNNTFSMTCLGNYYETKKQNDLNEAFKWYEKASQIGYTLAQYKLGKMYQDRSELYQAFKWFRESGRNGLCFPLFELAKMTSDGIGTVRNQKEGFNLFLRLSEQEFFPSYTYLGYCYITGRGTQKDVNSAIIWYTKAAYHGDTEASLVLEGIHKHREAQNRIQPIQKKKSC